MPTKRQLAAADRLRIRENFRVAKVLEKQFASALVGIGRMCGQLVNGFIERGKVTDVPSLKASLDNYANAISPWAEAVVKRMQQQAALRDMTAWRRLGASIGRNLQREVEDVNIGGPLLQLRIEHVQLIKSIPFDAAQRVSELAMGALYSGRRAEDITDEILKQGRVSIGKARTLARTAVSTTASNLTMVRAVHIGSEGYFWRGIMDSDERKMHVALEGKFIDWQRPPVAGKGKGGVDMRYHAGCGPNCRCYCDPVIPDVIL